MSPNPDGYNEAANLTRLLEQHYGKVKAELQSVAAITARDEVHKIAATNEAVLQRLIRDAIARERGGGFLSQIQSPQLLGVAALAAVLWLLGSFTVKAFPPLAFWRDNTTQTADRRVGGADEVEEMGENLPAIDRDPLHQIAMERYDSLWARRDPAFRALIEAVGTKDGAVLDTTVARVLERWSVDSATVAEREIVRDAAFQAALREQTGGDYATPINGVVNRERCAQDEYCKKLLGRWTADRTTGMRLLPQMPNGRAPNPEEMMEVERVVVYSRLGQ